MSLRLLTVALVATLALAGCSGGGTDGEPQDWEFGDAAEPGATDAPPEPPAIQAPVLPNCRSMTP